MWCVASAPIVPLARDLDARLGMPRVGRAAYFRTRPTPSQAAPAFLHKVSHSAPHSPHSPFEPHPHFFRRMPCHFLVPLLYLELHPRFFRTPPTPLLLSTSSLRAFPHLRHVPPGCTPFPPHGHRCKGTSLPKTQKNEHRSLGSGARFGLLSGRKRPVFLMFQKPQPKKTERTSCAKRMRMNMARG